MNDGYALMKRYVLFTYICAEVRKTRNRKKYIFFRRLQKCAAKFTTTADGLNEGIIRAAPHSSVFDVLFVIFRFEFLIITD